MPELRAISPDARGTPWHAWHVKNGHKPVSREELAAWLRRVELEAEANAKKFGRRLK